jgi:hypothetical protein
MANTVKSSIHHPIGVDNHDRLLHCTLPVNHVGKEYGIFRGEGPVSHCVTMGCCRSWNVYPGIHSSDRHVRVPFLGGNALVRFLGPGHVGMS